NHQIPWRVPQTRLYRGLELLGAQSFTNGSSFGGRTPGKININTMSEKEVFQALCDALATNQDPTPGKPTPPAGPRRHCFDTTAVDNAWNGLQQFRNNNVPIMSLGQPFGNAQDLQFAPYGNGPAVSVLGNNPNSGQPMFTTGWTADNHPY